MMEMVRERETPLEFPHDGMSIDLLRAVYRNPSIPLPVRMRAASIAIAFESPKLAVTGIVEADSDFATLLDRRIRRMEQAKLIEHHPSPPTDGTVEIKPPLARTNDRRFRRL
jgi:hypothetical protein